MGLRRRTQRTRTVPTHEQVHTETPVLGGHPLPPHPLGIILSSSDKITTSTIPHRALSEQQDRRATVDCFRGMLQQHHASPEAIERARQHNEAMTELGFEAEQMRFSLFPTNPNTRKGNLAEIVLAEYVIASCSIQLPVYRLRYNPNINESMKGDDVLAFDLDSDPVRILVGEAKFRGRSKNAAVTEIAEALVRSHSAGIPASLMFVAERLFGEGNEELGKRVYDCARLFALGQLRIDYVGMLLSDMEASNKVQRATPNSIHQLAMISFGVTDPDALAVACYEGLN